MSRYFENFQFVSYLGSNVINITHRTALLKQVFGDKYAFYPYRVKDGMRARTVAERYYGDPDYEWLVYFSNNIIDPYSQWPMDEYTFENHLRTKYGNALGRDKIVTYRVNWFEDTRTLTVAQYKALPPNEKKYWIPTFDAYSMPTSYIRKPMDYHAISVDGEDVELSVDADELSYWTSVTAYEIEEEENAKKANIRLLDSRLASIANNDLRKLLNA